MRERQTDIRAYEASAIAAIVVSLACVLSSCADKPHANQDLKDSTPAQQAQVPSETKRSDAVPDAAANPVGAVEPTKAPGDEKAAGEKASKAETSATPTLIPEASPEPAKAATPAVAAPAGLIEAFPGVRVDLKNKFVEFEGIVPIDAHDAQAPIVYLELVACVPDTKEHEAIVVTSARPSHVHAALLLIGLQPGKPGGWEFENDTFRPIDATGDEVDVRISYADASGEEVSYTPQQMIVDARTSEEFGAKDKGRWVFAGSRIVTRQGSEHYDADKAGMLIGLTTFGAEVIAWSRTISPDSNIQEPAWIASSKAVPAAGTKVKMTVRAVK